jgi:hypothetical protein
VTVAIADTTGATLCSAKTEIHKTKIATQTTIVAVIMVAAEGRGCLIPNVPCTTEQQQRQQQQHFNSRL